MPITKCVLAKLNSKISQKEKFAAQSKCSKCCPLALTQACSRPCHSLMAFSTTRCSRPDHVAIRRCIVCYRATFKLVLDYRKDFRFYQVSKRWDIVNWLNYNRVQNQQNRPTSDEVIVKVKRVTFFLKHSVEYRIKAVANNAVVSGVSRDHCAWWMLSVARQIRHCCWLSNWFTLSSLLFIDLLKHTENLTCHLHAIHYQTITKFCRNLANLR